MSRIISVFQNANYKPCALYLLESLFLQDITKYFAGVLTATSAMLQLAIPHLNIISKMDLIEASKVNGSNEGDGEDEDEDDMDDETHELYRYFYPDPSLLSEQLSMTTRPKFYELNNALVQLIDEYDMVNFIPFNIKKQSSMENLMLRIEMATQFSEALEPKEPKDTQFEDNDDFSNDRDKYSDVD